MTPTTCERWPCRQGGFIVSERGVLERDGFDHVVDNWQNLGCDAKLLNYLPRPSTIIHVLLANQRRLPIKAQEIFCCSHSRMWPCPRALLFFFIHGHLAARVQSDHCTLDSDMFHSIIRPSSLQSLPVEIICLILDNLEMLDLLTCTKVIPYRSEISCSLNGRIFRSQSISERSLPTHHASSI